jgi:ribosomal protein S21
MEVTLNETDRLEGVLKRFRREITKAGLCFYESPAVQRRRKSKAARRRKRTS